MLEQLIQLRPKRKKKEILQQKGDERPVSEAARTPTADLQINRKPESSAEADHYWSWSAWVSHTYFSKEKKIHLAYCLKSQKKATYKVSDRCQFQQSPATHQLSMNRHQLSLLQQIPQEHFPPAAMLNYKFLTSGSHSTIHIPSTPISRGRFYSFPQHNTN